MKHVTNHTARLITLSAGNLEKGVKRLRLMPGATTVVEDALLVKMLGADPFVKALVKKGDLSIKSDAAKTKEENAAKAEVAKARKVAAEAEKKEEGGKKAPPPPPPSK